ncbi:1-acyl-sn-glycerol-3-phosphate acyltransferase [Candidatus Rariloculus sp.]|uniref:1-acyl-sn-glycerol-3-phosphate acyltransferase n=1 Tax=Candidatus Rariloculus sp. TaxID=3101265 RepID=UPI003D135B72
MLLRRGAVGHETGGDAEGDSWPMGDVAWPWAALGWSGFLPARRNGTTARTRTRVELLSWKHDDLARIFYADPLLAVCFFRIVLDSVRRQFEWIRGERLAAQALRPVFDRPPAGVERDDRREFAPGIITALRASAFFAQFDDSILRRLAASAELTRCEPATEPVQQDEPLTGLWVLAGGRAERYFCAPAHDGEQRLRFLSLPARGGVAAGVPTQDGGYRAETMVRAVSACWFYRIPTQSIEALICSDPEFGRSFMQRQLARLAHLITAARLPRPSSDEEPEIVALKSVLQQNQTRIPVTSELHKVPHLLAHRLTTASALTCLDRLRDTGSYEELAIARVCIDMLAGVQAEVSFYRGALDAYAAVTDATQEAQPAVLRRRCDEIMAGAFSHLRTMVRGTEQLPATPGHIVIVNHLCCPAYYQLPNDYHFSFDTAFVSVLLHAYYGDSPVRVVRQSPGAEYGHNMFYSRLGHITVPTLESGIEAASPEELETLRRESVEALFAQGAEAVGQGENVLICPEGQCQKSVNSPARFYSGAFRLAQNTQPEPWIVPVAIAGFDRRFKDGRLVALVQPAFRLSEAMARHGTEDLRRFLDDYRSEFAEAVGEAQRLSRGVVSLDKSPDIH